MQVYYENHRDDMAQAHAWYARDNQCAPHFHNSIELAYVLEGRIDATLDGEELRVDAGMMLVSSSYVIHSYHTESTSYIAVAIIPLSAVPSARQMLAKQSFAQKLCPDDREGTLRRLICLLVDACDGGENPLVTKGLSYALLGLLSERIGLADVRPSDRIAFLREVLVYLELHHTEPLSVPQIAAHFGYSRSRFSHLIKSELGYTLMDYLSVLRCRHAAQLLRETDMPVSDVAMHVGFESLRTFYRSFKRQYNLTPLRYAKQL